ncbi:hypothetical protein TNCV_3541031 [Trichonephila clavipes]|nr:hypothetical protein TNCV_3541031 [Trichonephila clavipes]
MTSGHYLPQINLSVQGGIQGDSHKAFILFADSISEDIHGGARELPFAVIFVGRGVRRATVEGVEWDICVSARLSIKHVVIEAAGRFCREGVFLERSVGGYSTVVVSHFDIPRRGCVPSDRKCVLMWMDAFRATRNVSQERKKHGRKTVRTPGNVTFDTIINIQWLNNFFEDSKYF